MKRHITLATLAALGLLTSTASAQVYTRDHRRPAPRPDIDHRYDRYEPAVVSSFAPLSGPAGTLVTIRGDNFLAGMTVVYGGTLVTPSLIRSNVIEFAIPAGAVDGSIALKMPRSRREIAVGTFNVLSPPTYGNGSWKNDGYGKGLGRSRQFRRNKSRGALRSRWNRAFLASPMVRAELSLHAQRTARLERMLEIATYRHNRSLVVRIKFAISKEDRRHDREMKRLKDALIG